MSGMSGRAHTSVAGLEAQWRAAAGAGDNALLAMLREGYAQFSTPSAQRDAYGRERWDAEFIRLGDISPKLAKELWRALPYSRYKQMQEAACSPEDRCVPRAYQVKDNSFVFGDLSKISLRGILINPDLVPEKLLIDLGLADFSRAAGIKDGRLIEKCRPETILGLKLALERASSLETNNHRVLLLNPAAQLGEYPEGTRKISEDVAGMLLITRTSDRQDDQRSLMLQFLSDPHSAIRAELHINSGYDSERKTINSDLAEIRFMQSRLDREWGRLDSDGKMRLKREVEQSLIVVIEKLEWAENNHKEAAERLLNLAKSIEDKTGKLNPTVALTRITAAVSQFEQRRKETLSIQKHIDADKFSLLDDMDFSWALLKRYRREIERAAELVGWSPITQDEGIAPRGRAENTQQILGQITLNPEHLLPFRYAPYITFAKALGVNYRSLEQALRAGDRSEAQMSLVRMQIVVKLHAAYEVFEQTKTKAMEAENASGDAAQAKLKELCGLFDKLKEYFDGRQILPKVEVEPQFSGIFEFHRDELGKLVRGLKASMAQGANVDPYEALKNVNLYIRDTFRIGHLIKAFIPSEVPTPKFPNA